MMDEAVETDHLQCNIVPIHLSSQDGPVFSWIKLSEQQDTLVARQINGPIIILKVREDGFVARFVLDPNLECAFWDNEEGKEHCQYLFGQTKNGSIVVYKVDNDGVTETEHITKAKLNNILDASHHEMSEDDSISLIGCHTKYAIMSLGFSRIASFHIPLLGSPTLAFVLPLPQISPDAREFCVQNDPTVCTSRTVNGFVYVFDTLKNMMYVHIVHNGECVCQINLNCARKRPCVSCIDWTVSPDHSTLLLLYKDWSVQRIVFNQCAITKPDGCGEFLSSIGEEETTVAKHLQFHYAFQYCEVNQNVKSNEDRTVKEQVGFNVIKIKARKEIQQQMLDSLCFQSLELERCKGLKWKVTSTYASCDDFTILLTSKSRAEEKAVCFVNFNKMKVHFHKLHHPMCFVASSFPSCPHMIWGEKSLMYLSHASLHEDDLISWMMSYGGPTAADDLCQVNQWTRTAIPLTALESSLQQRQIDRIAFFFKSKQELFSNAKQYQRPMVSHGEVRQLESALDLVSKVASRCLSDSQAQMFGQRLTSLTLDFLSILFEDSRNAWRPMHSDNSIVGDMPSDVKDVCNMLMKHVSALRQLMQLLQLRKTTVSNASEWSAEVKHSDQDEADSSSNAFIEQFVKENRLSQLQSRMSERSSDGTISFCQLIDQIFDIVKQQLENANITTAQYILNNLGCNVTSTVWSLAKFYTERSLQTFIYDQLCSAATLNVSQRKQVEQMHQLFQAYSSQSFEASKRNKIEDSISLWPKESDPLESAICGNDFDIQNHCQELFNNNKDVSDDSSQPYLALNMAWLTKWTEDVYKSVLIDSKLLSGDDALSVLKSAPEETWRFLIAHSMLDTLQSLLDIDMVHEDIPWPFEQTSGFAFGWSHLRKELLRQLVRLKKIKVERDLEPEINVILSSVGGPMSTPHPLAYDESFTLDLFHSAFMQLCVKADLPLAIWAYCKIHNLDVQKLKFDDTISWLSTFQLMHTIPQHIKDKTLMFEASLRAAVGLWSASMGSVSIESLLTNGHVLTAVGTLSYMKEASISLGIDTLEKCLQKFPKLVSALLPDNHSVSARPHTSVYQLLMNNVAFNVRRLFGWHPTNKFAGEDSPKAMPHFSESDLPAVHGSHMRLSFPYYLKNGRPMYAFLSLLTEELDKRKAPMVERKIQQACGAALWIACQNFNVPHISSACVVFVELLGQDSAFIRTMLHAGRLLLANYYRTSNGGGSEIKREQIKILTNDIASELQACVRNHHRFGPRLISSLESAVAGEIKLEGLNCTSYEASQKWTPVVLLCQLLSLPLTTVFLKMCAETDNWLMFIWFSQLHQYPTQQLQGLLQSFDSPHLQDHLHYVLNNAESKLSSTSYDDLGGHASPKDKKIQGGRNTLGVKSTSLSSTDDDEDERKKRISVTSSFSARLKMAEFGECEMTEASAPDDVFRLLFHSQSMQTQWKCLLSAAVSLRNPLFAELAACCVILFVLFSSHLFSLSS